MKDVLESMKLQYPSNYILWSYKVKMILLHEGLWKYVGGFKGAISSSTNVGSIGTSTSLAPNTVAMTTATATTIPVQ